MKRKNEPDQLVDFFNKGIKFLADIISPPKSSLNNSCNDRVQEENRSNYQDRLSQQHVSYRLKDDAFLCLIVPTNRIDLSLRQVLFCGNKLTIENTKLLIDKSAYFIACGQPDLDDYIRELNLSKEPIDYSLNGDVYIQLFIPTGEDTINNDLKRMLLRNLPDNNAVVEEVYLLNAITRNIDRFYRA